MFQIEKRLGAVIRKRTFFLLCLAIAGSILSACGSNNHDGAETLDQQGSLATTAVVPAVEEKAEDPIVELTLKDDLGNEVEISTAPMRIFAPYLEDSLLKLGVKPVAQWANGNMGHDYLQEELKNVPKVDFSGGQPSPEVLMTFNPDLIILHTESYAGNGGYEKYSKIAPTFVFKNASGDTKKTLEKLGELLGKTDEATIALQAYEQKVLDAKEKLAVSAEGKKIAIIRFAAKGVSLMGGNYLCGHVVNKQLGIEMSHLTDNENSFEISMEVLPDLDVDYIFMINAYGQGTERIVEMEKSAIWKAIPAVKQGHVYEMDSGYWLGSGLIAYEKIIDDVVKVLTE